MAMHTILGAGGVIGNGLARELAASGRAVRIVSRHPSAVNASDQLMSADLTDPYQVENAVAGSEVAYLVVGLPYRTKIWEAFWPVVMRNTIEACKRSRTRLVFFDNVYLYGKVEGVMTESTPVNPRSRKGAVRAQIAQRLCHEMRAGNLTALIARSADFYGPGAVKTFVHPMVFEALRAGRKAAWLVNDQVPHAMTYTPDATRALALLGASEEAFGEVWHLPTHHDAPTGREFIELVANNFDVNPNYRVLAPWMLDFIGVFVADVRESMELLYQHGYPYQFSSAKFESKFFQPTSYAEGVAQTISLMQETEAG